MVTGESSTFNSVHTKRSSLQLGLRLGDHLALTDLHSEDPSELSHMALRRK